MLVSTLIESASRKINVVASGETMTAAEQQDFLEGLQVMLRSWSAEKINVFSSVSETFVLTAATFLYTWGSGGTIDTARPNQILSATIDSSNVTYPVEIIGESRYREITVKSTTGRPYALFPRFAFPYVQIYLYPVPSVADTLNLYSIKPFTETSSFSATSDTLQMPVNYEEAVIYNLAVRMASEFGKSISAEVAAIAGSSYNRLITLNAGNYVEPVDVSSNLPAGSHSGYNINTDGCR